MEEIRKLFAQLKSKIGGVECNLDTAHLDAEFEATDARQRPHSEPVQDEYPQALPLVSDLEEKVTSQNENGECYEYQFVGWEGIFPWTQ